MKFIERAIRVIDKLIIKKNYIINGIVFAHAWGNWPCCGWNWHGHESDD
jgi:hypothetical protein